MRTKIDYVPTLAAVAIGCGFALSACTFESNFQGTEYRCVESAECPSGFACVADTCRRLADSEAPCGTPEIVATDFTDIDFASLDSDLMWYHDDGSESGGAPYMTIDDGQLVFAVPGAHESVWAGLGSHSHYPVAGSVASIELVELPTSGSLGGYVSIEDSQSRSVYWWAEPGILKAEHDAGSEDFTQFEIPYDPIAHRWLQVREEAGQILWETSPDGAEWTVQGSMSTPELDPLVSVSAAIWKSGADEGVGRLVMDNLNGGVSGMKFCSTESITDDFDDGIRSAQWRTYEDGACEFHEVDGRLSFGFPGIESGFCSYYSVNYLDLAQSSVTVEGPSMDVPDIDHGLHVLLPDWQELKIKLDDGTLSGEASLSEGGAQIFSVQFDPARHRYWRLSGAGTTVYWELSSDGVTWQTMGSYADLPVALNRVLVDLGASTSSGGVSGIGVGFDNLNIAVAGQ